MRNSKPKPKSEAELRQAKWQEERDTAHAQFDSDMLKVDNIDLRDIDLRAISKILADEGVHDLNTLAAYRRLMCRAMTQALRDIAELKALLAGHGIN